MKLRQIIWTFSCMIVLLPLNSTGQKNGATHNVNFSLKEVALLSLASDSNGNPTFNLATPTEAGSSIDFSNTDTNNHIWINYSSINRSETHRRKIMVSAQGNLPDGIALTLQATEATEDGKGHLGKPVGKIILNNEPQMIIYDIGSSYTGRGYHKGHLISYLLELNESEPETLSAGNFKINIAYTLTDQN